MSRFQQLLALAIGISYAPLSSYAAGPCAGIGHSEQLDSLRAVYYRGGELPPDPSPAEISKLRQLKADPNLKKDAVFLDTAFPSNEKLQAIAIRDHDGDGIKDYRINTCGVFRENDPDADCDGVPNVLDSSPYDGVANPGTSACDPEPDWNRITNDRDSDGLPDQIEWQQSGTGSADENFAAAVQKALYRDYKIVLVDRRTHMPPAMAVELDHVIREIFRGQIRPNFAPLRIIAADQSICGDDDSYGWASPENSAIYLTPLTSKLRPILRLEILVHEITHTLQYALDFSPQDVRGFRTRNRYRSDRFHQFAATLQWVATPNSPFKDLPDYKLAVKSCDDDDYPFTFTYRGRSVGDWQTDWDNFVSKSSVPLSENPQLRAQNMVSRYGLDDPWEWDAEYNAAFVLNQLLAAAKQLCTAGQAAVLSNRLHHDIKQVGWDYVNENAIGLASYEHVIAPTFQVANSDWKALAKFFLLASYSDVCGP
jgi:hypothetical protein